MNFGAFAGGASQGFMNGIKMGKTLQEIAQERGIQELRAKGMEEAEAMRAKTAAGMIKEGGMTGQPASETPKPAPEGASAASSEPAAPTPTPSAPAPTPASPTASPDAASAATAASSGAGAAPSVSTQAPAAPEAAAPAEKPAVVQASPTAQATPTPSQNTVQSTGLTGANAPKFTVNGKGYATREEAQKAADAATPTAADFFMKNAVPKIAAGYMAAGDPAKAKAWEEYADSHNGKRAMKDWAAAYTAPDFDTAATKFGKYYTDHVNDGVDYTGHKMLTKSDGTQVAVVTLKDKATGKETQMELTRESMLALGGANNPQKLFETELARQTAADKMRYEAKLRAQQRHEDFTDKKNLEGYKQDRIDAREDGKGSNKKTTDPTERRALIRSDEMKNNPKFARMSPEEQNKAIDAAMETIYGKDANKKDAAAPVAAGKPVPAVKDVKIVYHKQTGEPYQLIDGEYVRVEVPAEAKPAPKAEAKPQPKPEPKPAPAPAPATPPAAKGLPEPSDYVKNMRKSDAEKKADKAKDDAEAAKAAAEMDARAAALRQKITDDFKKRYGQ